MEDISLHLLDVAENALTAGAQRIEIRIFEMQSEDLLRIEIEDNGRGMDEEAISRALDPFYTTKASKRVGLGLPLLAQSAREAGGAVEIHSEPGKGTKICATFQLSHPDLVPLGNILETLAVLIVGHPEVQYVFDHRKNGEVVCQWKSS